MSDIASGLPNEREAPFVDPWSKEPNHQDVVPIDAVFVGTWDNDRLPRLVRSRKGVMSWPSNFSASAQIVKRLRAEAFGAARSRREKRAALGVQAAVVSTL
jgi:hypothetical protein